MAVQFTKATKHKAKLRLALIGPAGAGKTYTALRVATGLGGNIALIDTERGSASKYSGVADFDVLELESFAPERYIEAIRAAEEGGYSVLVIDSLSHAWAGKDGILEFVDKRKAQSRGNDFGVWRDATPLQNSLVDAILTSKLHIICTMRSKMEYVIEKDERTGKNTPRKVGLQPVQRDQIEFEFDLVGDLDQDHKLVVTKSRIEPLADAVILKPGPEVGKQLADWLEDGAPAPERITVPEKHTNSVETTPEPVLTGWQHALKELLDKNGMTSADLAEALGAKPTAANFQKYIDDQQVHYQIALEALVLSAKGQKETVDA